MANLIHSALDGTELHVPQGFTAATNDTVLSKNPAGTLEWVDPSTIGQIGPTGPAGAPGDLSTTVLLAGRAGGQTVNGGTGTGDDLLLNSTVNATKGSVLIGSDLSLVEIGDNSNTTLPASSTNTVVYCTQNAGQDGLVLLRADQTATFKTDADAIHISPQGQSMNGYGDFLLIQSNTKAGVKRSRIICSSSGVLIDPVIRFEKITAATVSTPPSGEARIFMDNADDSIKVRFSSGNLVTIAAFA